MTDERRALERLVRTICLSLEEIYEAKGEVVTDFLIGQIYAYVECLEVLQGCATIRREFLNYEIEEKFPLP